MKKVITILLAMVMCLSSALAADSPSSWATTDVENAISTDLVPQNLQEKYTQATTRAEFAALTVTLYEQVTGTAITERKTFADTTDINVEKAAAIGIVAGVGDNMFSPDTGLTREQAAVMLSRLATVIGKPLAQQNATFSDNSSISSWAIEEVGQIQAAGVMSGVGNNTFAPQSAYTREQSIVTVLRLYDVLQSHVPSENNTAPTTNTLNGTYKWTGYDGNGSNVTITAEFKNGSITFTSTDNDGWSPTYTYEGTYTINNGDIEITMGAPYYRVTDVDYAKSTVTISSFNGAGNPMVFEKVK